mmetsp:Transcript_129257/g.359964  ORF Transcript_129257/g.359964 Transcript_129257/m.359964 type:complete len:202 (+) Transcript_129257:851-1456(+)
MVVTRRGHNLDLWVEGHPRDGANVTLESRVLLHVGHPRRLEIGVRVGVGAVLTGPRCHFRPPRGLVLRHLPCGAQRLVFRVRIDLVQLLLQVLALGEESVALKPHEHLFLHGDLVLVAQLGQRGLVLFVVALEALQVHNEFVLLLYDPPVVHPVEVPLLPELVPALLGGARHRPGLLDLLPQQHHLLVEAVIPHVDVRHNL